ncbi:MAG: glycosyl hydrolase [Phycisphaerae bacterium]|nr:glycosyl hydrolase [Phycisphaerae bacterium]MCZ2399504.1 glycosyl hydrolase [Phycisphaerae bacterium]
MLRLPRLLSHALPCLLAALVLFGWPKEAPAQAGQSAGAPPASAPASAPADGAGEEAEEKSKSAVEAAIGGLRFRALGPALMSGRIGDLAVDPANPHRYYVAVASGNVWRTTNGGVTFEPIFDKEGAYSIGCLALDPRNPHVLWVGTGENNSQRSVGWGDGVYRTRDGGKSWQHVGLKQSEHIGRIAIDPRDSNVVYVAAQGPLWRDGGDRGLYKTSDGGATWERVLHVSDMTGINEVHLDPRDPDVLYASAYQRRRHVWTLINGGPESGIHKSTDGGRTWRQLKSGLPGVDKGRIGMAISPADPDVIYAIVEAAEDKGGVFRSTDRGETWEKRSGYMTSSPQYYNELVCDPKNPDHLYALDTFLMESLDGGRNFRRVPRMNRHVDDHALWIDPNNTDHLIVGSDGGLYETWDHGRNWRFAPNLPVTQFYRVTVDNSLPFYWVYGGTQDNSTLGGPSRTTDSIGIANEHWIITVGGDGFETQVDPQDPMIVYSQWQHGGLVRHDRRSGEVLDIKPREKPGDPPLRWNWDSPLLISPHDHKRLYFAANILFRSDDRGESWRAVSPDLTRQLDRNQLEVFGRIQNVDAVAKNRSTSWYGNIVSLSESPLVEGLLYVGTDDGLIQVSEDGGLSWRRSDTAPHVPELTYVSCLWASQHDADAVYAAFDNHKRGDFKPYLLVSRDRGRTWASIAADLKEPHVVYSVVDDHVKPDLLFCGTEFGAFCSLDGGERWRQLKNGLPTIAVRDIAIQKRESDLVLATFGRGFYVLDDYSPLRHLSEERLAEPVIFPIKAALRYMMMSRLGGEGGRGWLGATHWSAENPPFGAVFTYYNPEKLRTRKEKRKEAEKEAEKAGQPYRYPTIDELRAEDEEREPALILTVRDAEGNVVRRIGGSREKGLHRAAWDLRYPAAVPISLRGEGERAPWDDVPSGPMALPGRYTVEVSKEVDGQVTRIAGPAEFDVVPLELATFAAAQREEVLAFQRKVARLQRAVRGALRSADEAESRLAHIRRAVAATPELDAAVIADVEALQARLSGLLTALRGDRARESRDEPVGPSIRERVETVVGGLWNVTSPPTRTQLDGYRYAAGEFEPVLAALRKLMLEDLVELEARLEAAGAPWTPGRVPQWEPE